MKRLLIDDKEKRYAVAFTNAVTIAYILIAVLAYVSTYALLFHISSIGIDPPKAKPSCVELSQPKEPRP